ncbi:divergent PAP2 family protein [bacterium]|nr:divergent PAP2 family protein [bacterium]
MYLATNTDNQFLIFFDDFLHNQVLWTAITAWAIAVIAKAFVTLVSQRRLPLESFLGPGGMPSTHTSPIAGMAFMVGFVEGFDSTYFAIGIVLMSVVMYDASGIRRAAGNHAKAINMIFKGLLEREQIGTAQLVELRELLGHEPIEVAGGAIIGFLTAFYIYSAGIFAPIL